MAMDPIASLSQAESSQTVSNNSATGVRSPSRGLRSTFNADCIRIVGNYRQGAVNKIDALFQLIERASDVEEGQFGEQHVADLLAPYHRMLNTVEKEIVSAGGKPSEDEEEDSEREESLRKRVRGSGRASIQRASSSESNGTSDSEAEEPNTDSEDDVSAGGEGDGFKLYLANLLHLSIIRRKKKLPSELRKTNTILVNWAHDPHRVKCKWLESPFLPEFPESELYNII
jgi:hypothetical protein